MKAEHPALNLSEISRICYARFGRRPDERTVRRVLEEPLPLRMTRRYPPYREISKARERRVAVVALHAEGWTVKAIASYLRDTAYVALERWIEEGEAGASSDRKSTRLNSSHANISYAVFCLKKKKNHVQSSMLS